MSFFVEVLGGRTLCFDVCDFPTVASVKARVEDCEGIPVALQRFSSCSRLVRDLSSVQEMTTLRLSLDLLGGKGGFGANLKALKDRVGQMKTKNFSACRDLNGRRLRHVDTERSIEAWNQEEHKIEHNKLKREFANIKSGKDFLNKKGTSPC